MKAAGFVLWLLASTAMWEVHGAGTPKLATNLDGQSVDPFTNKSSGLVLVFIQPDCPIANRFAPEIKRLEQQFSTNGIRFFLVYADPSVTPDEARTHLAQFDYKIPALLDPQHFLVAKSLATTTPEAALFDDKGRLVYHGRISDRFVDFGKERPRALHEDLREAMACLLQGSPVTQRTTKAIGCHIPGPR